MTTTMRVRFSYVRLESCRHHPGEPFFHDAYKGWSCCRKKCTDFTDFLNIEGCTVSKHSNKKRPEPEKPAIDTSDVIIDVKPSIARRLTRPSFDTALVSLQPIVGASAVRRDFEEEEVDLACSAIHVGTTCKNSGCGMVFDGDDSHITECVYHPGAPVFHEGLKYWSCCRRRTTDFDVFLNQAGCAKGTHVWMKEEKSSNRVQCKWDHYQTGSHVVVSIYARKYCPNETTIKLNPIRLKVNVIFPRQDCAAFSLDIELNGVIIVDSSSVQMFGSKIEIQMRKAEAGSWSRFDVPVTSQPPQELAISDVVDSVTTKVEVVDLGDL